MSSIKWGKGFSWDRKPACFTFRKTLALPQAQRSPGSLSSNLEFKKSVKFEMTFHHSSRF